MINYLKNAKKIYYDHFGLSGLMIKLISKVLNKSMLIKVHKKEIKHPFYLRSMTSDIETYMQILKNINETYVLEIDNEVQVIIDAGANIGLSSIYFANKYPQAMIIALEPEKTNYELLKRNTEKYSNVKPLRMALWNNNDFIEIMDIGLGHWGFMVKNASQGVAKNKVKSITVEGLLSEFNIDKIDIFKIDIEGAEKEVFSCSKEWIDKVEYLIIELHDRMKEGCTSTVLKAVNGKFSKSFEHGEHTYFIK